MLITQPRNKTSGSKYDPVRSKPRVCAQSIVPAFSYFYGAGDLFRSVNREFDEGASIYDVGTRGGPGGGGH